MERLTNKEELKRIELSTRINTKYFKSYFLYSQLFEYENTGLEPKEVDKLKSELEELKQNVIVPKFKIGKTLFFITNIENQTIKSTKDWFYVLDNEGLFIETNNLPYNDCFYDYTFDRVFSTKKQAEKALKKLEEK